VKLSKLKIQNYRLLEDFSLDLSDDLSLVIGKNNTGKTSILNVLDGFLNKSAKFSFEDFSISFKNRLKTKVEDANEIEEEAYIAEGISLTLFIDYKDGDDISQVSKVMMDLDPENNTVVLRLDYSLDYQKFGKLRTDYREFAAKEAAKHGAKPSYKKRGLLDLLQQDHGNYFAFRKLSLAYDKGNKAEDPAQVIDLATEGVNIASLVNFKYISASRGLSNQNLDKRLSAQTSRIYERTEAREEHLGAVETFKDQLSEADQSLSVVYKDLFGDTVEKVKKFGGIKINESELEIISSLQHRSLLEGNTTVVYKYDDDHKLPESHNGLGYMNLISMIFEITILVKEFQRDKASRPADINILFIEEPEAHTHPQMQYVFIKNIKNLLSKGIVRGDGDNRALQYIITTHSSHIVADSDFDDIKYLRRENNRVAAKNLKDLKAAYGAETTQYQFLTQYLTLSKAESFFADKIILIEGDTERILMPTIFKKIDLEEAERHRLAETDDPLLALRSQNISTIEVGAYSHIFEKFIDFLGIRTLIITDLDAIGADGKACEVSAGTAYSNAAIKFFFGDAATLENLKPLPTTQKQFVKQADGKWAIGNPGTLCVTFQTLENGRQSRSFEECFIHLNRDFVTGKKADFRGIKNAAYFDDNTNNAYVLAGSCINKKTHFALDVLYHSDEKLSNWKIPAYIKEALLWLKAD
jgi:predicted ATP-binding protein involved in virulence